MLAVGTERLELGGQTDKDLCGDEAVIARFMGRFVVAAVLRVDVADFWEVLDDR